MKPAPFDYLRATSVEEAVAALRADDDAKVVAGGQSLAPLLSLRLARPTLLVDVGRLPLAGITVGDDTLELGALVRHRTLETDARVAQEAPLLALAAPHIGHVAIRNRGTLGGSIAHADPAAELPAVLLALDAVVVVQGADGVRELRAADVFEGYFTTSLAPDEVLVAVRVRRASSSDRFAFEEWAPRQGDFATAGVALAASFDDAGTCTSLRAAALGVDTVPLDLTDAVSDVVGADACTAAAARAISSSVRAAIAGDADRGELAGLLAARAAGSLFAGSARAVA